MRFVGIVRHAAWLALAALLSACAGLLGPPVVFGTASYGERTAALPSNSRLEVTLVDVSDGSAAEVIANSAVDNPGASPIRFAIAYDPARIDELQRYAVEAVIRSGDRVLYRSAERVPVLTEDYPTQIAIYLQRVPPPPPPAPPARQSPSERAVATIRNALDAMDKVSGSYQAGEMQATYDAFLDGDALAAVRETRTFGDTGASKVAFYYRDGILLTYEEEETRTSTAGAPGSERTNRTTLALNFSGGRYTSGRKTVNGTPGQPSEADIRDAVAEARDARDRLIADAAMGKTSAGLGPVRFGCADGSKFLGTFGHEPLRVVLTAVGHPSAVLLPQPARTGFRYSDGHTDLRGKGREIEVRWEGAQPVRCTAVSP
jgi:putative lipoprotein